MVRGCVHECISVLVLRGVFRGMLTLVSLVAPWCFAWLGRRMPQEAPPKQTPKTLESTRDPDRTVVKPADDEVFRDEAEDEFAKFFSNEEVCV